MLGQKIFATLKAYFFMFLAEFFHNQIAKNLQIVVNLWPIPFVFLQNSHPPLWSACDPRS